jgi:hypothetical protein
MDGMNWFRRDEIEAIAQQDVERNAFRTAVMMTVGCVVLSFAFVLGLGALGVMPGAEEFSTPQILAIG